MTMTYNDETIQALARLREVAREGSIGMFSGIARDLNTLDNAGVFAALDEQTDYAPAVEILAEVAVVASRPLDPAEWGDTTAADLARHQGLTAVLRDCTCGRPEEPNPSLHSGLCPVWALHHGLNVRVSETAADELDAGDRAAMRRLAERALTQPDRRAHGLD
jgi:hypothetical protein